MLLYIFLFFKKGQSSSEVAGNVEREANSRLTDAINEGGSQNITTKLSRQATSGMLEPGNDFVLTIWDFGGQPIYHVIQRIFMASLAIVCVVFNLAEDLDVPAKVKDPTTNEMYKHRMTNLQFILYYIRSIFMNSRDTKLDDGQLSPPVILIGTHLRSLEGSEEERKNKAKAIFRKIEEALAGKPYEAMVSSSYFTIENSVSFDASKIKELILKFAKKIVRSLPLKWLQVQRKIHELKNKHIHLPTSDIIALLDSCEVKHDAHRILLEYLHDIGELLYFPDDEALKEIIVLNLMQIVGMFKTIITVVDPEFQEPLLKEAWRKLDSGILEEHLLRHLWKKFDLSEEAFNFFISLMQKFGLVCERKIKEGERIFYVLSRLKPEYVDLLPIEDYGKRAVSIFHDFGGYLPDDLFQRGVTKFIEKFQVEESEPKLAFEHVELDIQYHRVILNVATIKHRRMFQTTIIRRMIFNSDGEEDEPSPSVCKEVLKFLQEKLRLFCQSGARGVKITLYIPCVCSRNMRDAHMHILHNFDKKVLPCGSNGMEMTRYRRLFCDYRPPQGCLPLPAIGLTPTGNFADCLAGEGLQWPKVNRFLADEQQTEQAIVSMLTYWRDSLDRDRHQLKVLCIALREHGNVRLAGELYQGDLDDETTPIAIHIGHLADVDMLFIAKHLSNDWITLGIILGFKRSELQQIELCFRFSVVEASIEMLVKWREKHEANVNHLAMMDGALEQLEREDIREELQTYYQQRYQQQNIQQI
ncbi:uncharacterized protein LOC117102687 [Anneissia japonica]|uniref:uncharacterized protein LOC117102687 n=1 Tax=Anneissia japonica TaxID=1529436 RepID=UPI0014255DFD|nr:uncharacterized protein LOC117102687 [Anneissia japonica]